jgi:pilus assembly protein CpaE
MAKILVIDDEADLLEMMRLVLERRGEHETVLSAEGRDGLAKALANPPDLAIIDVMMPNITGYEICRQLRANPSTASLPIIILTARAQPVDRDAALSAGADAYMTKPVMMAELLEQVDALLTRREAGKPSVFAGTYVLLSLRGGIGVTTLAVNLAATLAPANDEAACLIDLCPSSGHVALQLGLRPKPNWADLVQASGAKALDAESIAAHLLQHGSGLRVLASPFFPIVGQGIPQEVVQTTLGALQQQFPIVVVDTPSVLNEATMAAVEAASSVGLVVAAEPSSIQTTIGTLRVLEQWSDKLHLILNQVTPGPQPPAEAIERALKQSLAGTIPFDSTQARALAQRAPLALNSTDSPLVQAVQKLTQALG